MRRVVRTLGVFLAAGCLVLGSGCATPIIITRTVTPPPVTVTVTPAATGSPGAPPSPAVSGPVIVISYTPVFTLDPGSGSRLTLDLGIENKGYPSLDTSPANFSVLVSNLPYRCDLTASSLETVDLPDGGKTSGRLVFSVPAGTASSRVGFKPVYSGIRSYNIQWVKH